MDLLYMFLRYLPVMICFFYKHHFSLWKWKLDMLLNAVHFSFAIHFHSSSFCACCRCCSFCLSNHLICWFFSYTTFFTCVASVSEPRIRLPHKFGRFIHSFFVEKIKFIYFGYMSFQNQRLALVNVKSKKLSLYLVIKHNIQTHTHTHTHVLHVLVCQMITKF